ncbi:hypothetical protein [Antrihabitans cavernicola]|uniref:Uncharacterized protein n=1 Tax=Antrihabitans cavernicola TaxID=2495913 RepID=A0A5A7SIH3_9NOCA|nr:hypothetical protein [Spelaeibacter cavernicola]KAA0024527.1 hypothetical protein FOY51_00750 [Spelaeibacter cavernicola]
MRRAIAADDRPIDQAKVERYITYTRWIWFVGTAISLIGAGVALLSSADSVVMVLLAVTLVQAAIAIPAVLVLPQRGKWARIVVMVLGALSLGGMSSALQMHAWPSLLLNLALGSTFALMVDRDVKAAFKEQAKVAA